MLLGCSFPVVDISTGPAVVRDYAQAAEGLIPVLLKTDTCPVPGAG